MATGKKIPRDEVERRIAFVESALVECTPLAELYPAFEARFKVRRRCAERYVARVHARWKAEAEARAQAAPAARVEKVAELGRRADLVFHRALGAKDFRAATNALDLQAKLHGLYRPEATGESGPVDVVFECEPAPPGEVPAAPHVAPGGDPPRQ